MSAGYQSLPDHRQAKVVWADLRDLLDEARKQGGTMSPEDADDLEDMIVRTADRLRLLLNRKCRVRLMRYK